MKILKRGNLLKLVAFFVIAATLTCTVAFAANGWQSFLNGENSDKAEGEQNQPNGEGDNDKENNTQEPKPIPEFLHAITGLEITEQESHIRPLALVFSQGSPLYGISSSYLTIEVPTEKGETRYIGYSDNALSLGKIGSIGRTRGYITDIASAFGGILIHRGSDDSFEYGRLSPEYDTLDLEAHEGYCYSEYTKYYYSNGDLLSALLINSGADTARKDTAVPYAHIDYYNEELRGSSKAAVISIEYSPDNVTSFVYDSAVGEYSLYKNDARVTDPLNDRAPTYKNVFILFANTTTHETENATQAIPSLTEGGTGYYFTGGTAINISWGYNELGNLVFYNENGRILSVNRGTSYISFAKASEKNKTYFE